MCVWRFGVNLREEVCGASELWESGSVANIK